MPLPPPPLPPPLQWSPPFVPPLARRGLPAPPLPSPFDPMNAMMQMNRRLGPFRQNNAPPMGLQNIQSRVRAQMNAANAVNFPTPALTLLTLVLPSLARLLTTSSSNLDIATAIHALMTWHAGTQESSGVPYLIDTDLLLAYETCLSAIKAAGTSERLLKYGPRGLVTHLETALSTDRTSSSFRRRTHPHPTTLLTFRALAEISRQTSSHFLASLLSEFFQHHQRYFWTPSDPEALAWWVYALCRLHHIPDSDIRCVLEAAVRDCPDVVDILEDYADDAGEVEEVWRIAVDVEEAVAAEEEEEEERRFRFGLRGRFRARRRGRLGRRSLTPEWWDQRGGWRGRRGWGRSSSLTQPPPRRPNTAPLPEEARNARLALQAMKVIQGAKKLKRLAAGDGSDSE